MAYPTKQTCLYDDNDDNDPTLTHTQKKKNISQGISVCSRNLAASPNTEHELKVVWDGKPIVQYLTRAYPVICYHLGSNACICNLRWRELCSLISRKVSILGYSRVSTTDSQAVLLTGRLRALAVAWWGGHLGGGGRSRAGGRVTAPPSSSLGAVGQRGQLGHGGRPLAP